MIHTVGSLSGEGVLLPLAVWTLASGAAVWLRRRREEVGTPALLFAAYVSLGLIVSVTLFREGGPTFSPEGLLHWSESGWRRVSYDPLSDTEVLLNTALFTPAALLWTLLTRRPLRVLASLSALSLLIECVQAVTGLGANDVADILANTTGAALGVAAASATRSPKRTLITTTAILTALVGGVYGGAHHRQKTLHEALTTRFTGTDLATYEAWESNDTLYEKVFSATSPLADGTRHDPDKNVQVRYPASFFGLPRCVFVEWTPEDVNVYGGEGTECTRFMG